MSDKLLQPARPNNRYANLRECVDSTLYCSYILWHAVNCFPLSSSLHKCMCTRLIKSGGDPSIILILINPDTPIAKAGRTVFCEMALVSNQSLTPTRLDPNAHFTPSNYPDRRSVIAAFKRAVSCTSLTSGRGSSFNKPSALTWLLLLPVHRFR